MEFNSTEKKEAGVWPLEAEDKGVKLTFSQNWKPSDLLNSLAQAQARRILDVMFLIIAAAGAVALVLQVVTPAGNLWRNVFLASLLFDLIFWTRILVQEPPKLTGAKALDVKQYFSAGALEIFNRAISARGSAQAQAIHLLVELLKNNEVRNIFYRLSLGYRPLSQSLLPLLSQAQPAAPAVDGQLAKIPFLAFALHKQMGLSHITPGILLLAVSQTEPESKAGRWLAEQAVGYEQIRQIIRWQEAVRKISAQRSRLGAFAFLKPAGEINRALTSLPTPVLDKFSTDLTLRAKLGNSPVVLGREQEINNILRAFESNKYAVLLVGEHGSGRSSLIDILAQKMLTEDVPQKLTDKRLVRLELAQLVGEGENAGHALTASLNEALRSGSVVLAVEDLHEWAAAQASGVSLLSILISAVKNSGLALMATTTPQDFQSVSSLHETALFERIDLEAMSREDVVLAACVHASVLEARHKIFWTINALESAVELSSRYVSSGRQPQKTIKILDLLAERAATGKDLAVLDKPEVESLISEVAHVDAEEVGPERADKLLHLEQRLHEKIIGQDQAVSAVAAAMRRAKVNLGGNHSRPLASFLFVGPTGVGKTALARALAEIEFSGGSDSENSPDSHFVRLDLSEYNLPESVEKLLGGRTYVSSFVSQIKEKPYCVLLLDEFEKAHPDVQNLFLQVMDAGHLTDGAGNRLDMTNTLLIATSNAASGEIKAGLDAGEDHDTLQKKLIHQILPVYFRPELLNRFDGIILFKPLTMTDVGQIIKLQLEPLTRDLSQKGIDFAYTDAGIAKIASEAYDAEFGARPLQRYLQDKLISQISELILARKVSRLDKLTLAADGQLQIQKAAG